MKMLPILIAASLVSAKVFATERVLTLYTTQETETCDSLAQNYVLIDNNITVRQQYDTSSGMVFAYTRSQSLGQLAREYSANRCNVVTGRTIEAQAREITEDWGTMFMTSR